MCETLPVGGPTGLCQQLACMAAVLRTVGVTHLDMNSKNMLIGTKKASGGAINHSQVVLYDFDMADMGEAFKKCPDTFLCSENVGKGRGSRENGRGLDTIGGVLMRLVHMAGAGYAQCADAGSIPPYFECPFDSLIRDMLPPRFLNERDNLSLLLSNSKRIQIVSDCTRNQPETEKAMLAMQQRVNLKAADRRFPRGLPGAPIVPERTKGQR